MKYKFFLSLVCIGLAFVGLWLGIRLLSPLFKPEKNGREIPAENTQELMKKRGETILREQYNRSLIVAYQKMLEQYPESLDLKKKLANAYLAAGEKEMAEKLLKEISEAEKKPSPR